VTLPTDVAAAMLMSQSNKVVGRASLRTYPPSHQLIGGSFLVARAPFLSAARSLGSSEL
jgi:hypothetical protein